MALLQCPDCGNSVSDQAASCPACGCPMGSIIQVHEEKQKAIAKEKNIKIIKYGSIFLVILAVILIAVFLLSRSNKNGLYCGAKWGSTQETIEKKFPDGTKRDKDKSDNEFSYTIIEDSFLGMENVSSDTVFGFTDNALTSVSCLLLPGDNITTTGVVKETISNYNKLYGDYEKDGSDTYLWTASKSTITLFTYKTIVLVTYKDNTIKD